MPDSIDLAVAGLDLGGLGADPMAALVALRLRTATGPIWMVVRELYEVRITFTETVERLREWHQEFRLARIWCDHSQLQAIEALIAAGLPVLPNKVRDIQYGIRTVYGLLKTKRLRLDPKYCQHLVEELRHYAWKVDRSGQPKGKLPDDRSNHCIDCLRYLIVGEGETPPEEHLDPVPPEDQPTIYRGTDGLLRDNIEATVARRKQREDDHPLGEWWDELVDAEEPDDQSEEFRQIAHHLGMPWRG